MTGQVLEEPLLHEAPSAFPHPAASRGRCGQRLHQALGKKGCWLTGGRIPRPPGMVPSGDWDTAGMAPVFLKSRETSRWGSQPQHTQENPSHHSPHVQRPHCQLHALRWNPSSPRGLAHTHSSPVGACMTMAQPPGCHI